MTKVVIDELLMSQKVFAAGVLIQKEGLILASKRKDTGLIGFPVGKVEEGEDPLFSAIRECFEETGHVSYPYHNNAYAGLDDQGKIVKIYRSDLVCQGAPTHPEEGGFVWVTPNILVSQTPWPEYNRAVLEYFGIRIS